MKLFEFVIGTDLSVRLGVFGTTLYQRLDVMNAPAKYGITIDFPKGFSNLPSIGLHLGANDKVFWINAMNTTNSNESLKFDPDTAAIYKHFIVGGYTYLMKSGTVTTKVTEGDKIVEKSQDCWIVLPQLQNKTPMGDVNHIPFTTPTGIPQSPEAVIRTIVQQNTTAKSKGKANG